MISCPSYSAGFDGGRRRRWHDSSSSHSNIQSSSESSPLEVDVHNNLPYKKDYSTFSERKPTKSCAKHGTGVDLIPQWWWWRLFRLRKDTADNNDNHTGDCYGPPQKKRRSWFSIMDSGSQHPYHSSHSSRSPLGCSWRVLYTTLLLAGLLAVYYRKYRETAPGHHRHYYTSPASEWDHNIYYQPTTNDNSHHRHYLVAQLSMGVLTAISSRPNRAYARQHGMDYVQYATGGRSSYVVDMACFDKIILLNMILDQQRDGESESESIDPLGYILSPLFSVPTRVEYDAVALLPPDSIVTSLDSDIFDMFLPPDKLVGIAGWHDSDTTNNNRHHQDHDLDNLSISSKTDIIVFNLRHKYANAVAKLWWDLAVEPSDVSCGAGNDIALLVDAIESVVAMDDDDDNNDLASVIAPLHENSLGFVSPPLPPPQDETEEDESSGTGWQPEPDNIMRGITPSTPGPRAQMLLNDLDNVKVQLQTTADSVCYRYYPRCDVL